MLLTRDANNSTVLQPTGKANSFNVMVRESVRGKWNYRYVSLLMILLSDQVSTEKNLARGCQFALFLLLYYSEISF